MNDLSENCLKEEQIDVLWTYHFRQWLQRSPASVKTCVLSHGQSNIEREFSVGKEVFKEKSEENKAILTLCVWYVRLLRFSIAQL